MREIILDTETTGLEPIYGDRSVEIGCIELLNKIPTDNQFHQYINPHREMPEGAFKVHGLSSQFLETKPDFADIVDGFLQFIKDAPIVIHNAPFDMAFINMELLRQKMTELTNPVIDTVSLARTKFPGSSVSLDALCRRFTIDNSNRDFHGALLDANLLADVYIELTGGRQQDLKLSELISSDEIKKNVDGLSATRPPRIYKISDAEERAHREFLETLNDPLWFQL